MQEANEFAIALYQTLKTLEGNLALSPYSIFIALAVICAGARGETEQQISRVLHLGKDGNQRHRAVAALTKAFQSAEEAEESAVLRQANVVCPQKGYPFLAEFIAVVEEYYKVAITPADYQDPEKARKTINAWVREQTQDKILEPIPTGILNPLTRLVSVNTIYFKGSWTCQFDRELTVNTLFAIAPNLKVQVPMMAQQLRCRYGNAEYLQILELSYAGNRLSMLILLPKREDGLAEVETALSLTNLEQWLGKLRETNVQVFLPRFQLSRSFALNDSLVMMGIRDAFDRAQANFSGMDGREHWLYLEAILHEVSLEVNETGSEAAAASTVVVAQRSLPLPVTTFKADRPFLFFIRDIATEAILFMGRVVNPT